MAFFYAALALLYRSWSFTLWPRFSNLSSDGVLGFCLVFVAVCLEHYLEDGVSITVICGHEVLVAAL